MPKSAITMLRPCPLLFLLSFYRFQKVSFAATDCLRSLLVSAKIYPLVAHQLHSSASAVIIVGEPVPTAVACARIDTRSPTTTETVLAVSASVEIEFNICPVVTVCKAVFTPFFTSVYVTVISVPPVVTADRAVKFLKVQAIGIGHDTLASITLLPVGTIDW